MNSVTLKKAKEDLVDLIDRVVADSDATIICGDDDKKAVLMSLDEFNSWQETLYLLSNPANAEHLRKSVAEAQSGKVVEKELIEPWNQGSQNGIRELLFVHRNRRSKKNSLNGFVIL